VASRRVASPLRVTERVDYALRSVLLLARHQGDYLTTKVVADHYGMSTKMLASVLWNLRSADILESRPGWHGGFRLALPPHQIPLSAVIAAAAGIEDVSLASAGPPDLTVDPVGDFWQALDQRVQATLTAFTVADLAGARALP
jgi:Rrf2 family protein